MKQQEVWNKIAEPWQKYRKNAPFEVLKFLENKKGKVLDLGCGSGRNMISGMPNIEYYGVDFSGEMLKLAEKDAEMKKIDAKFFGVDIGNEKLPFSSEFFDSAVFLSTLHCIEDEKNRENALKELFRVMKKEAKQ